MMGALKKITAWVLIGIFQVFLMHQALPHEHHAHDKSIDTATAVEHHHHHHDLHQHHGKSQHSHDTPAKDHSKSSDHHHGLLGMLFGEHSHSNGINHQHILTPTTIQSQKVKVLGAVDLTNLNFSRPGNQLGALPAGYSPPIQSYYFYNPSLSHRGPPSTV